MIRLKHYIGTVLVPHENGVEWALPDWRKDHIWAETAEEAAKSLASSHHDDIRLAGKEHPITLIVAVRRPVAGSQWQVFAVDRRVETRYQVFVTAAQLAADQAGTL